MAAPEPAGHAGETDDLAGPGAELAEGDLAGRRFHRLRVREVVPETPDACSLVFDVPGAAGDEFAYRPGQFLTLRVPHTDADSVARCYSLSSSPDTDGFPRVTVKRVDGGRGSNWLCDHATAGTELDVLPPAGVFTPASLDEDLLLLAGGSGITPVISILRSALERGSGRVVLVYANRDERSVIFADHLRQLRERHPVRFRVVHWLESVQGLPDRPALRALAEPYAAHEAFVCGPGPFMDAAAGALGDLGVPRRRVHIERFRSLSSNPFDDPIDAGEETREHDAAAEPGDAEDSGAATVGVDLDGQHHQLRWPRQRKLLDLLLESGLDAPYSCRQGACSACACRIESGEVKMLNNEILEQEDLDDGIILACQSLPITDEVHVSYE